MCSQFECPFELDRASRGSEDATVRRRYSPTNTANLKGQAYRATSKVPIEVPPLTITFSLMTSNKHGFMNVLWKNCNKYMK